MSNNPIRFLAIAVSTVALIAGLSMIAKKGTAQETGAGDRGATVKPGLGADRTPGAWRSFTKPSDDELRKALTDLEYRVTQQDGTERAFQNVYWNNKQAGIYVDVVSGEPLFSSRDKFRSGTGWPSFTKPLVDDLVIERQDPMYMARVMEVRSKLADSHLGHVFEDGPEPTGLRYCINSAALDFIPASQLGARGYGEFAMMFPDEEQEAALMTDKTETATLAGGCFWGMEDILREIPGVIDTEVGYTGGTVDNPTYRDVSGGRSGHAESIQITFDPSRVSYETLLDHFFRMHDPTTKDRQGNDRGSQYRSAIFVHDDMQRETARRVIGNVEEAGFWKKPIVTEVVAAGPFYKAEEYHQDYLEKNPNGYTCHYVRNF
ncbi:MAG: bifunctional methionine sulfoxide reductase B/A protein [Gemmatimonadetes bacterium]|nr:bifunctional methionine sulfoxide reductase B/A protein [Gemmatimonadota bacterium]